jgi:5-methylcytosine-specific restriction endonuclease McrA
MSKKVLLLNGTYDSLGFISAQRAIILAYLEKIDVLTHWDEYYNSQSLVIQLPAVAILKQVVKRTYQSVGYSRKRVFLRDLYLCQYCSRALLAKQATIDHIVPRALGGKDSFSNCVTACSDCNLKKANKTLQASGLKLIQQPTIPKSAYLEECAMHWHPEWSKYIK